MTALSTLTLLLALALYGAASRTYFVDLARGRGPSTRAPQGPQGPPQGPRGPRLMVAASLAHAAHVGASSLASWVCPVRAATFVLSLAALLAVAVYLFARRNPQLHLLGLVIAPWALACLLASWLLGRADGPPELPSAFVALHVLANLGGLALFLLASAAAALYLVQDRRLKQKKAPLRGGRLPPLDVLDRVEHRFLLAGFPFLTVGILSGTAWTGHLEAGSPDTLMRLVFGYATWLLFAAVLLLRAMGGWSGRRAAWGTLAGFGCALAVLGVYLSRPGAGALRVVLGG